jgi:hypothetical protein
MGHIRVPHVSLRWYERMRSSLPLPHLGGLERHEPLQALEQPVHALVLHDQLLHLPTQTTHPLLNMALRRSQGVTTTKMPKRTRG